MISSFRITAVSKANLTTAMPVAGFSPLCSLACCSLLILVIITDFQSRRFVLASWCP